MHSNKRNHTPEWWNQFVLYFNMTIMTGLILEMGIIIFMEMTNIAGLNLDVRYLLLVWYWYFRALGIKKFLFPDRLEVARGNTYSSLKKSCQRKTWEWLNKSFNLFDFFFIFGGLGRNAELVKLITICYLMRITKNLFWWPDILQYAAIIILDEKNKKFEISIVAQRVWY